MHPSVMYVFYSGTVDGSGTKHATGLGGGGGFSPSFGCFTLTSPAITAEGLCLYNSGYLHWVRKLISYTHMHHLTVWFISDYLITVGETQPLLLLLGTVAASLTLSYWSLCCVLGDKMAVRKLQCNISIIKWFVLNILETLLHCLLLKCWQVLIFRAASEANRDLRDLKVTSSVDSHSCCWWCLEGHREIQEIFGASFPDRQCWRRVRGNRTNTDLNSKTWIFHKRPVFHSILFAAKYQRWHCLSTLVIQL